MNRGTLAIRILPANSRHHLWNNNGTWWCHYTLHLPDFTKKRVRVSLDTHDPREARAKRDSLFRNSSGIPRACVRESQQCFNQGKEAYRQC